MNGSAYDVEYLLTENEIKEKKVVFDYYKISNMIKINNPWREHAAKKVLFGGKRGHKDRKKDINEAIWSLKCELQEIERLEELEKRKPDQKMKKLLWWIR